MATCPSAVKHKELITHKFRPLKPWCFGLFMTGRIFRFSKSLQEKTLPWIWWNEWEDFGALNNFNWIASYFRLIVTKGCVFCLNWRFRGSYGHFFHRTWAWAYLQCIWCNSGTSAESRLSGIHYPMINKGDVTIIGIIDWLLNSKTTFPTLTMRWTGASMN